MAKRKTLNDCMYERYHVCVYNSSGVVIDRFDFCKPNCSGQSVFNFIEARYIRLYGYVPCFHRVEINSF